MLTKKRNVYTGQVLMLQEWSKRAGKKWHAWKVVGVGLNGWYAMADLFCVKHKVRRRYAIGMLKQEDRPKQCRECYYEACKNHKEKVSEESVSSKQWP